jgi:hypothetical protein
MTQLILTVEQVEVAKRAPRPLEVRDTKGNVVGILFAIWTDADILEANDRCAPNEPLNTPARVLEFLRNLKRA